MENLTVMGINLLVQFLERPLLGLGHEEEDHAERGDVQSGVETEGTGGRHGEKHTREGDGKHGGPSETGGDRPRHTDLTMRKREDFGGVCEGDGTFSGRVEGSEQVDEGGDQSKMSLAGIGDQEAKTGDEQRPGHVGEGEEQEGAAAEGVDGPDGRPREDEVDETESERRPQSLLWRSAGVDEDGRGVEGNDVDTAHLLRKHDGERGQGGAADTRNGEQLDESLRVVGLSGDGAFKLDLRVDVVDIASGLKRRVSQTKQRAVRLVVPVLLDVPARGFRAHENSDHEGNGRDEGRAKLQTPGDCARVDDGQIGAETEEDTEGGPHLPAHDQTTSNGSRDHLSGVNRHRRGLCAHTDTEKQASDEQLLP